MDPMIEALSPGNWLIRVERKLGDETTSGQVVVVQASEPQPTDSPHVPLAGARAWLSLAQTLQDGENQDGALASARAGVEELGEHSYAVLGVREDTSMHINLAEEHARQGKTEDAATRLIRALETRIDLYVRLHADTIAE
jgi:negative regulator of sigma E activity